jgi:GNAT superfamily N-acetyltransferase
MESDFQIRRANTSDTAIVTSHRRRMFAEAGHYDPAALQAMEFKFLAWLPDKLATEEYLAWLAVTPAGQAAAGVGLWLREWMVNPNNLSGRRGHVVNVYTLPEYRRLGLALALMRELLSWCAAHEILSVFLHPTEAARPLYQALGFEAEDTMSIRLRGGKYS